ncbi:MAG: DEAD/DEAH box helicase, partial [Trebonia sp.]
PGPGRMTDQRAAWDSARTEFRTARERVAALAAERTAAAEALLRLPGLRRDASTAYASITAAEDAMRDLAAQRIAAERSLRAAWYQYGSVVKALHAHARAKPDLRASLATRFGARREWRARQAALDGDLREHAVPVEAAQQAIAGVQAQFVAAMRARAAAADELRRLTAECTRAQEVIALGRKQWGGHFPSSPDFFAAPGADPEAAADPDAGARRELASPWADPEFAAARTELFLAALGLHKALIAAQAGQFRRNLSVLVDFLSGKSRPGDRALLTAWQTLFLVVPVVSTTFASVPAMFGGLGAESIGWLLIDEAGQAPPQQAAGAIWRARRTVVVGDPMQLEPVVTLPWGGQQALLRLFAVPEEWAPSRTSVQRVADRLMRHGTLLPGPGHPPARPAAAALDNWVGMPLRVHRRCDRPMFEVSNEIAYGGLMVFGTRDRDPFPGHDRWYDVRPGDARGHWIPAEGDRLRVLLHELLAEGVAPSQVRVLSPFRQVAAEAAGVHRQVFGGSCSADDRRKWVGTVHTMQGREADVVILVLGGSPGQPAGRAFATRSPNLLNVAVTRARRRLYVIGDHAAWSAEPPFDVLARHVRVT